MALSYMQDAQIEAGTTQADRIGAAYIALYGVLTPCHLEKSRYKLHRPLRSGLCVSLHGWSTKCRGNVTFLSARLSVVLSTLVPSPRSRSVTSPRNDTLDATNAFSSRTALTRLFNRPCRSDAFFFLTKTGEPQSRMRDFHTNQPHRCLLIFSPSYSRPAIFWMLASNESKIASSASAL